MTPYKKVASSCIKSTNCHPAVQLALGWDYLESLTRNHDYPEKSSCASVIWPSRKRLNVQVTRVIAGLAGSRCTHSRSLRPNTGRLDGRFASKKRDASARAVKEEDAKLH